MPRFVPSLPFVVACVLSTGCNVLTGANGLSIAEESESTEQGGPGEGSSTTHDPPGTGGVTGAGGQPGGTTTNTTTTPTTTGTTTTTAEPCVYPSGPTGVGVGQVVPQSLTWQGFAETATQPTTVAITDYFDCDGTKGIDALLVITSATWCGACQEEASELESHAGAWAAQGIHVLTLMIENAAGEPATIPTAQQWKDSFGLVSSAVVADPNVSMANTPSFGTPLEVIIDPRTMTVVDRQEGWSPDYAALQALANKNN